VARSLLRSRANSKLLDRATEFLTKHAGQSEILILAPTRAAASELAILAFDQGCQGVHSFTLLQVAANLAAPAMASRALAPISRLGIEAIANRIVHAARRDSKLQYFSPVAQTPGFPRAVAKTIAELVSYAKANPGKLVSGAALGIFPHFALELLKVRAEIDMIFVPYKGAAPAITDLLGGQIQMSAAAKSVLLPHIQAGKVRPLGVTTAERSPAFPEIPTVGDFVPGYEASLRNGLGAPKATPADVIERLNKEVNAGLVDPKLKAQFADLGSLTMPLTTAEYGKIIVEETEKWGKVIRGANIKVE